MRMNFKRLSFLTVSIACSLILIWCNKTDDPAAATLAQCLTEKWAIMYGTERCSHCQAQKELFWSAAFPIIKFVDCDKEKNICALAGVKGYPTRVFADKSRLEGQQTFETLATKTWCTVDNTNAPTITTWATIVTGVDISTGVAQ
jgi:hypothetical protein